MSEDTVLLEISDNVATVTLNRPEAMNALSKALRSRLYHVMKQVDEDDSVVVVVLSVTVRVVVMLSGVRVVAVKDDLSTEKLYARYVTSP